MRLTINQNDYRKHRVIVSSCSTRLAYFARSKAAATPVSTSSFKKKKKEKEKERSQRKRYTCTSCTIYIKAFYQATAWPPLEIFMSSYYCALLWVLLDDHTF